MPVTAPSQLQQPAAPGSKRESALACIKVLGTLAGLFDERRKQLAESVGLSVQQWSMLEVIQTEHFMPSLFAQEQDRSPAAVSKILRQLSNKELITASVSSVDGRQRNYVVTAKGNATLSALRAKREEAIEQVWLDLSHTELDQFETLGERIAGKLRIIAHRGATKESEE